MQQIGALFTIAQEQAVRDAGCDAESYELISAVHTALSEPDASMRWLSGENVFRGARLPNDAADRAEGMRDLLRSSWIGPATDAQRKEGEPMGQSGRVGRNDPCPCGSGRKWKKCCGKSGG